MTPFDDVVGRRVLIAGHFVQPVQVLKVEDFDGRVLLQVRTAEDSLRETVLSHEELHAALSTSAPTSHPADDASDFFLRVESARIRLAYAHDPHFAVALTGIQVLPHQLEAVYERMLPQIMLRFLLADDPGAGKTIMAGLLIKELRLRGIVERVLVLSPAPLTIQWQDELATKFDERFEVMTSDRIKGTLTSNPWNDHARCIASIDLAKREEVRERLLESSWDLVVIDEAHKCAARTDGDKVTKTQRYQLAERIAHKNERLLLLTATPHQGNADQFEHFLRLLDEDQFVDIGRDREVIQLEGNPWYLRRMKEDLRDFEGQRLFTERHALTQPFDLTPPEQVLYDEVTEYINEFLPRVTGKLRGQFALTRIVFQRRLASSLGAITSSLARRHGRFSGMLSELDALPPAERARKLEQFRLVDVIDVEQDPDDETEVQADMLIDATLVAETIERLREEVVELARLTRLARDTVATGHEAKLDALRSCLARAEFSELKDGRGKLLIFTEHRDTQAHLLEKLAAWGYTTTQIHGGMSPQDRKQRQIEFQRDAQICVATEAAGEGINLQFCHLMINYDLPWNPNRLEQRMGRIHRIGQERDVYVFNFVATSTVEGVILARLFEKLADIKAALGDRVFDVIGELLKLNDLDLEDMLREAAYNPKEITEYLDQIERLSAERLQEYEEATGIALAKSSVDLSRVQGEDWRSQERRLMPEFVEEFFLRAAARSGLAVDDRGTGLWRVEHVPQTFRDDSLRAVEQFGRAEPRYPKLTFRKDVAREAKNLDGDLVSPAHPLFAALDEVLCRSLSPARAGIARFIDPFSSTPYRLHFFDVGVEAGTISGGYERASGALVTVVERADGTLELGSPDILHDLTPREHPDDVEVDEAQNSRVRQFVLAQVQYDMTNAVRAERAREIEIRKRYLEESFEVLTARAAGRLRRFTESVQEGHEEHKLARDNARRELESVERRGAEKLDALSNLAVAASGRIERLGTAIVETTEAAGPGLQRDEQAHAAAMAEAMRFEHSQGWDPTDVSILSDGSGFDIRSVGPPDEHGKRGVKRIAVKGRAASQAPVEIKPNERVQSARHRESFWLYVVWEATTQPRLTRVQNPVVSLHGQLRDLTPLNGYRAEPEAIARAAP